MRLSDQNRENNTMVEVSPAEEVKLPGAITLKLDRTKKHQVIESFGTSGCWWAQYVGGWDKVDKAAGRAVREEIARLLFDKDTGIGLTCYRYNIGAGSAESQKGIYRDVHRRAESFETAPFTYDWSKDENAVWFLKKAVSLGVEEVVMFCNSPPERLTLNGTAQVSKGSKENLATENYDDFARYVMDVSEHFINEGIPVKFISPINEPQWDWFEGQEGCHYEPGRIASVYRAFLKEMESRPALKGVSLSGPESGEWKGEAIAYSSAILNDSVLGSHMDTIDNHSYWSDKASKEAFKRYMDARYKEVKLRTSEWCEMVNGSDVTMDSAFHLAEVIAEDLTVLDVVSWQNWVAVAPGGYRDGLIYINEQEKNFNPLKRLWAYGNYSRFIRPGYERIETEGDKRELENLKPVAFTGFTEDGEEQLILVTINESDTPKKVFLDIPNTVEYTNISVYETSESRDLEKILDDDNYKSYRGIDIGRQSVTTIILSRAGDDYFRR